MRIKGKYNKIHYLVCIILSWFLNKNIANECLVFKQQIIFRYFIHHQIKLYVSCRKCKAIILIFNKIMCFPSVKNSLIIRDIKETFWFWIKLSLTKVDVPTLKNKVF